MERLAIPRQTVYAEIRGSGPMVDIGSPELFKKKQPSKDKAHKQQKENKGKNGEQRQRGQEAPPQERRLSQRQEVIRRQLKVEEQNKELETFLKSLADRQEKKPLRAWTQEELKEEVRRFYKFASDIDREGIPGYQARNEFWTNIFDGAVPILNELVERYGVDVEKWAAEENLPIDLETVIVPPPPAGQEAVTLTSDDIIDEDFREAVQSFEDKIEEKPIEEWTLKELQDMYSALDFANRKVVATGLLGNETEAFLNARESAYNAILNEVKHRVVKREIKHAQWQEFEEAQVKKAEAAGFDVEKAPRGSTPLPVDSAADLNPDSYPDGALRNNAQEARNAIEDGRGDEDLLSEIINDVRRLQNEGAVNSGEAQRLLADLDRRRVEARRGTEERHRRRGGFEDRRSGLGFSGERILDEDDRSKINADIDAVVTKFSTVANSGRKPTAHDLVGEDIDYYFNRSFDLANSGVSEDYRTALGNAGSREQEDFKNELNTLRAQCEQVIKLGHPSNEMLEEHPRHIVNGHTETDAEYVSRMRRKLEVIELFRSKYDVETKMRELLHNAFFIADTEGEFKSFADYCKSFASVYADQAFLDAPEVEIALRVREQVLYEIKRERGFIHPEYVTYNPKIEGGSEWERRSKDLTERILRSQNREIPEWKIARAMSLSRGLGMVFLRFPEIVAEQHLAAPSTTYQSQPSVPWEKIVWELNPMDFKLRRYEMGFSLRSMLYAIKERHVDNLRIGVGPFSIKTPFPKKLWNQDELKAGLAWDTISVMGMIGDDKRMIDMRNFFQTGGPFSHTGWRPYMAAVEENREGLRPLLARNPGLAMRMIFNRYENQNQAKRRWRLMRENPNMSPEKLHEMWEKESADNKDDDEKLWKDEEVKYWTSSTRRIPHVILRIITDEANLLTSKSDRKALLRDILGEDYSSSDYREAEIGLTIAKENLMRRRQNAFAEMDSMNEERRRRGQDLVKIEDVWSEQKDQLLKGTSGDFAAIEDGTAEGHRRRELSEKLHEKMVKYMEEQEQTFRQSERKGGLFPKILGSIGRGGFAYAITAEDVPWSEFTFGQTGPRGFFTRKINDAFSVAEATEELTTLVKYTLPEARTPEDIIAQLSKIYKHVEIYGKEFAEDAIADIATGIIRLYEKDGILKVWGLGDVLGMINGLRHRGNSYAQTIFGEKAMEWDSDDIYNFTESLRSILVGGPGEKGWGLIERIRKETGGTFWQAMGKRTRVGLQLLFFILLYEFVSKLASEK